MSASTSIKMDTQIDYNALKNMDIETIPFTKRVEAFYDGTKALTDLSKQIMIPQLIDWIEKAKLVVGEVLLNEHMKQLKDLEGKKEFSK